MRRECTSISVELTDVAIRIKHGYHKRGTYTGYCVYRGFRLLWPSAILGNGVNLFLTATPLEARHNLMQSSTDQE